MRFVSLCRMCCPVLGFIVIVGDDGKEHGEEILSAGSPVVSEVDGVAE